MLNKSQHLSLAYVSFTPLSLSAYDIARVVPNSWLLEFMTACFRFVGELLDLCSTHCSSRSRDRDQTLVCFFNLTLCMNLRDCQLRGIRVAFLELRSPKLEF
jgi:hypothetical protein